MKIIRSSKCSLKFSDKKKIDIIQAVLKEYGKVVNFFINEFWEDCPSKSELLKPIVDLPKTWLSYTLRQIAAREAIDMVISSQRVFKSNKEQLFLSIQAIKNKIKIIKPSNKANRRKINNLHCTLKKLHMKYDMIQPRKPKHNGNRMQVTSLVTDLQFSKKSEIFDAWLHFHSIGNNIIFDIPINFHDHYNKLNSIGKRLNSYIITKDYVQFAFEVDTGNKKEVKTISGIDTGINALASTSDRKQLGTDIKDCINRVKRCKYGSRGKKRAIRALKQRIDETAKEVVSNTDLVVVEKLKNMNNNSKVKGILNKSLRNSIGTWNYRYWLDRLEQCCENNRVSFRTVSPYKTSQRCSSCGYTDRRNRNNEIFLCQSCGHTDNADINAAINILIRFLTGTYGSCYKPLFTELHLSSGF